MTGKKDDSCDYGSVLKFLLFYFCGIFKRNIGMKMRNGR